MLALAGKRQGVIGPGWTEMVREIGKLEIGVE